MNLADLNNLNNLIELADLVDLADLIDLVDLTDRVNRADAAQPSTSKLNPARACSRGSTARPSAAAGVHTPPGVTSRGTS